MRQRHLWAAIDIKGLGAILADDQALLQQGCLVFDALCVGCEASKTAAARTG